jgi:2-polyprenyl-3-methyl-5-hydroxy-6-metoxy-1,4-benzoquinol methylase
MPTSCRHPSESQQYLFDARDYITGDRFAIEQCQGCGIAFTRPPPAIADMGNYYPFEYYSGGAGRFPAAIERLQRSLYRRRAATIEGMLGRKGRVLDIGCGPGFLLREFRERGWQVLGTEFTEQAAAHARDALRLPISIGDISDLMVEDGSFDAVVMWHVLEHMTDPQSTVARVARLLRPGGIFLCAVPNFGSAEAHFARDKWFHLDVPRHLNHFTLSALRTLLSAHGFMVERTSFFSFEYDYFSFTQSTLNRTGLRHNLLYNLLRGSRAKFLSEKPAPAWQKLASLLLAAPLGIASVPVTTLAGLFRTGATVTIHAHK